MGDVQTGFYPQAPTNGFGSMSPAGVVGLVQGINANKLFQQEFEGRQGIANAYRNNVNPDGTLNQPGLLHDLATSGYHAGEGVQQGLVNAKSTIDLGTAKTGALGNAFSSLTGIENPTKKDVYDLSSRLAISGVPPADIKKYQDFILSGASPAGIKRNAAVVGNQVLGQSAGELTPIGYDPVTKQPVLAPHGQVNVRGSSGIITAPPPGAPEAAAESQKQFVTDQKTSAQTIANLRNLDIALPMVEKLNSANFGPGSPEFAKVKSSLITAGVIDPKTSDVTVRQEVGKYLLKYATMAQNAGRSDQALGAALGSNPNLDLTQPANLGLIKNQIGLDKMDAALPKMFKLEHPGEADKSAYNDYKTDFYDRFDRRVFSYDKLSPDERRTLVSSLGGKNSPAYRKFAETYELAKKSGIITPDKQ